MTRPNYEAIDGHGLPYIRPCEKVGDLPTPEARIAALESATHAIAKQLQMPAQPRIGFGTPVHVAFGLTRPQAKNHNDARLLLAKGESLALDFCHEYK